MSYFSCDDEADAVRTLARIYRVDVGLVEDVANGNWPSFILDSTDSPRDLFVSPYLPSLMAQHLSADPDWEIGEVAYYHRSAYDGSTDWFREGLLASSDAANTFLNKIAELVPVDSEDRDIALANIKDREYCEGYGSGGPYAFDVFDYARRADQVGMDYSLPEFLVGRAWVSKYGVCYAKPIWWALREKLKPVIVKFSGAPSDSDAYITGLWRYLFDAWRGEPETSAPCFTYTFLGAGKSVSADRIIQIIDLGEFTDCKGCHD